MSDSDYPDELPKQHQANQPGKEHQLQPEPHFAAPYYRGSGKLQGKTALITGGDSGIGRAVAVLFAREGANVAIAYLNEDRDADETRAAVKAEGANCLLLRGDLEEESVCHGIVEDTAAEFGNVDVLVNNAAVQYAQDRLEDISREQLEKTFRTNVYPMFHVTASALKFMPADGSIINTTSITAFRGSERLVDYAATKGAILAFTRSMASQLVGRGIRVNAVAPGPVWTPLIPASLSESEVAAFGQDTPMGRAAQPEELAPAYVYLASKQANYVTGQVIHVNGGSLFA